MRGEPTHTKRGTRTADTIEAEKLGIAPTADPELFPGWWLERYPTELRERYPGVFWRVIEFVNDHWRDHVLRNLSEVDQ